MTVLVVGAAGNLGSRLTERLLERSHSLRLLVHKTPLPPRFAADPRIAKVEADLADPKSLEAACADVDCIVYSAGALFRPRPESFLPLTNTKYVENLVDVALAAGVGKFVLLSFPHVEGHSTPEVRAQGRLEADPVHAHSRTRLAAERYLFRACAGKEMTPIVLRAGVIYGPGARLTEAARLLMRARLFAIWRTPTWVHLLALEDFLAAVEIAVRTEGLSGIYNLCDDEPLLLQDFLDRLAEHWGYRKPPRLPDFLFRLAGALCEEFAALFGTAAPINRDIIGMGMTSVVADTSRMKRELMPQLSCPTLEKGLALL